MFIQDELSDLNVKTGAIESSLDADTARLFWRELRAIRV